MQETEKMLPDDHRPYTDKYFMRTNEILKKEDLNPMVGVNVFTRGEGRLAGMNDLVEVVEKYSDIRKQGGELWIANTDTYTSKQTLALLRAPAQSIVELETMYLSVVSDALSQSLGLARPDYKNVKQKFMRLKDIYKNIPITYFGARHYHWSLDSMIAKAALDGGAVQTSTDNGSSYIGKEGVGTTPHFLTIILGYYHGRDVATLKTAQLFHKHMPESIPRVTLADTFNREISDTLMVARFFRNSCSGMKSLVRLDTCGENIGEGCSLYNGKKAMDPEFRTGTGVTIEIVTKLRQCLINEGFGDSMNIFLSSGFGDEKKAKAFVNAHQEFKDRTGYDLFVGVGIGEVTKAKFCTGDIFEVQGRPFSKTGREMPNIDYSKLERVI